MLTTTQEDTQLTITGDVYESPDGIKFLKRVIRRHETEDWQAYAWKDRDWKLTFIRRIPPTEPGDAEVTVTVTTETRVQQPTRTGKVKPFHDAEEVIVRDPEFINLCNSDTVALAKLLLLGKRPPRIEASAGSTHSSQHGLAFYSIQCSLGIGWSSVTIGSDSVTKDGIVLTLGSVNFRLR